MLVYSKSKEEHESYLHKLLGLLKENQLKVKYFEYEFWIVLASFLGHKVLNKGVMLVPQKVKAIRNWPKSTNVIEIYSVFGLASNNQ